MIVLMSYMCLVAYAFGIPTILVIAIDCLFGLNFSWETKFFITLAVCSIISVHASKFNTLGDTRTLSFEKLGEPQI